MDNVIDGAAGWVSYFASTHPELMTTLGILALGGILQWVFWDDM